MSATGPSSRWRAVLIGLLDALGLNRVASGRPLDGRGGDHLGWRPIRPPPGRVASLTLISPVGFGPEINAGYLRGFAEAESRRDLKPHLLAAVRRSGAGQPAAHRRPAQVQAPRRGRSGAPHARAGSCVDGDKSAVDVTAELASFGGPAVAVWGREDKIVPASNAAGLGNAATVHVVDGAGHMAHMEKPHAVVAAIREALGA